MRNQSKLIFLLVFLLTLPFIQCTSSFVDRGLSDYLMLENGRAWVYLDNNGDTVVQKVVGDTAILGDSAKLVNFGGYVNFYRVKEQDVSLYSSYVTYRGGEEVELENRFTLYFETPFVNGNKWEDNFETSKEFLGDTFRYVHNLDGKVVSIDKVDVPAGNFADVYKVKIEETRYIESPYAQESDTVVQFLYFAPDVGLVKKVVQENGTQREYVLVSY